MIPRRLIKRSIYIALRSTGITARNLRVQQKVWELTATFMGANHPLSDFSVSESTIKEKCVAWHRNTRKMNDHWPVSGKMSPVFVYTSDQCRRDIEYPTIITRHGGPQDVMHP